MSSRRLAIILITLCSITGLAHAANEQEAVSEWGDQWEYEVAFGYSLSQQTEIGISQVFSQIEGSGLSWSAIHLVLTHQLITQPVLGLSPSLVVDYERATDREGGNVLIGQVAFEREQGAFTFMIAPLFEHSWVSGESANCIGIDGAVFRAFGEQVSAGAEMYWKQELGASGPGAADFFVVPTVAFGSGVISYSLGVAAGLDAGTDEPLVRLGLGVGL